MNKLSIIITYFNNEDYISECIHSLKAREIKILTLLLSMMVQLMLNRNLTKALKSYDKDVHFIQLQENTGHAHARNVALEQAHGQYVLF